MATTNDGGLYLGGLNKTAKFAVTADNDVLLSGGNFVVHGFIADGTNATALNIDAGADITAFPASVASTEDLCVTTSGADNVTVIFSELPVDGYTTLDT